MKDSPKGLFNAVVKITVDELAEIKETVELFPNLSLSELSETFV